MSPYELGSLIVAGAAFLLSSISLLVATRLYLFTKRVALHATALQLHNFADQFCTQNPELYQLHGISLDELKADGISAAELSYVIHSFDAGDAYHRIENERCPQLSAFRKELLKSAKVRFIWKKYVRNRMVNRSHFTDAVDWEIGEVDRGISAGRTAG